MLITCMSSCSFHSFVYGDAHTYSHSKWKENCRFPSSMPILRLMSIHAVCGMCVFHCFPLLEIMGV